MFVASLIPCSNRKMDRTAHELVWDENTTTAQWCESFDRAAARREAANLYTGRVTVSMLDDAAKHAVPSFIISAGAGLIPSTQKIPSYQSTFQPGKGPAVEHFERLPFGGGRALSGLAEGPILSFAPLAYHKALLGSTEMQPFLERLVVAHTSPLARETDHVLCVPARAKEILACSSRDLGMHLHRLVLSVGIDGAQTWLDEQETTLRPLPIREKVDADALDALVREMLAQDRDAPASQIVRHLRDKQFIAVSHERVAEAVFRIRQTRLPFD